MLGIAHWLEVVLWNKEFPAAFCFLPRLTGLMKRRREGRRGRRRTQRLEMASSRGTVLSLLWLSLFALLQPPTSAARKSFVVYMGSHSHSGEEKEASLIETEKRVEDSHNEFLGSFLGSKEKAQDAIFYSYARYINGFAADLAEEDAMEISKSPEVMSVFPNREVKLHTTRSWSFMGLERDGLVPAGSIWTKARFGEDTIIGNLDTGVWPESRSFDDAGVGPVPARWKGTCDSGSHDPVRCNRKLIGARYFNEGYAAAAAGGHNATLDTPRDTDGHGTHTLSTAAGRFVKGVNIFGLGNGTAKGGSPAAHVAAYKTCFSGKFNDNKCFAADLLAAFDAAIHDGVDVLSVSLGRDDPVAYFVDAVAIGSFHAVMHGVTVVCSAGNRGPAPGTVANMAPWILTVGASTMDREFLSCAILGNGKRLKGQSVSPSTLPRHGFYPLISSANAAAANSTLHDAQFCLLGSLDPNKVKGKIVACRRGINWRVEKGQTVLQAGGVGMILANSKNDANDLIADAHFLPATHIGHSDGIALFAYINSTRSPVAKITAPRTVVGTKPAPFMTAFSSRGPNSVNPEILKPDVAAPGVDVLAAFTQATGPSGLPFDKRRFPFMLNSGTSMACPHVSGIAGLLKTLHPDWSPAAIKSAIMTTARTRDNTGKSMDNSSFIKATPFSYGAGHVRPNLAMDPGLVYDAAVVDYLDFLCALGYTSSKVATFSATPYSCPRKSPKILDVNYPSISVPNLSGRATVTRKVKNVGIPGTYTVRVKPPAGISVTVRPTSLKFSKVGEERTFRVTLDAKSGAAAREYVFGRLTWSDGVHHVRSPLVVRASNRRHD